MGTIQLDIESNKYEKTSLPPKSPRPSMRLQLQKPLPHQRRQLTKHNSLGPFLPPQCRLPTAGTEHITHENPGPISTSRACPLTQFTHPPKATTQLLDASNRTKHVPKSTNRPARHILVALAARRSDMQPTGPTNPPLSEPKVSQSLDRAAVAPILPRGLVGFWGAAGDLLIRVLI